MSVVVSAARNGMARTRQRARKGGSGAAPRMPKVSVKDIAGIAAILADPSADAPSDRDEDSLEPRCAIKHALHKLGWLEWPLLRKSTSTSDDETEDSPGDGIPRPTLAEVHAAAVPVVPLVLQHLGAELTKPKPWKPIIIHAVRALTAMLRLARLYDGAPGCGATLAALRAPLVEAAPALLLPALCSRWMMPPDCTFRPAFEELVALLGGAGAPAVVAALRERTGAGDTRSARALVMAIGSSLLQRKDARGIRVQMGPAAREDDAAAHAAYLAAGAPAALLAAAAAHCDDTLLAAEAAFSLRVVGLPAAPLVVDAARALTAAPRVPTTAARLCGTLACALVGRAPHPFDGYEDVTPYLTTDDALVAAVAPAAEPLLRALLAVQGALHGAAAAERAELAGAAATLAAALAQLVSRREEVAELCAGELPALVRALDVLWVKQKGGSEEEGGSGGGGGGGGGGGAPAPELESSWLSWLSSSLQQGAAAAVAFAFGTKRARLPAGAADDEEEEGGASSDSGGDENYESGDWGPSQGRMTLDRDLLYYWGRSPRHFEHEAARTWAQPSQARQLHKECISALLCMIGRTDTLLFAYVQRALWGEGQEEEEEEEEEGGGEAAAPPPAHHPAFTRAVSHLAAAGWYEEADAAVALSAPLRLAEGGAPPPLFPGGKSRLEWALSRGDARRAAVLLRAPGCGAPLLVWSALASAPPALTWDWRLFDAPCFALASLPEPCAQLALPGVIPEAARAAMAPRGYVRAHALLRARVAELKGPFGGLDAPARRALAALAGARDGPPRLPPELLPIWRHGASAFHNVADHFPVYAKAHPEDGPLFRGFIPAWRAAHPHATAVCLDFRRPPFFLLADADFEHLRGVVSLELGHGTAQLSVAAFEPLGEALVALNVEGADRFPGLLGDAALAALPNLLYLYADRRAEFTDAGAYHLRSLHTLHMQGCDTVTPAAFAHLRGLAEIDVWRCPAADTAEARKHLRCVVVVKGVDL